MFPTSPENELKPGMLSRTKGFSIAPYNLLSLPEFGAQRDPYDYEIWIYSSYQTVKGIIADEGKVGDGLFRFELCRSVRVRRFRSRDTFSGDA